MFAVVCPRGLYPKFPAPIRCWPIRSEGDWGYELTNHITLQVSYRFFKTRQLEFTGRNAMGNTVTATTNLQGHLFEVGARYRF